VCLVDQQPSFLHTKQRFFWFKNQGGNREGNREVGQDKENRGKENQGEGNRGSVR